MRISLVREETTSERIAKVREARRRLGDWGEDEEEEYQRATDSYERNLSDPGAAIFGKSPISRRMTDERRL
jgi:hypothetical protein